MSFPRVSIRTILFVVLLVAADLACLRFFAVPYAPLGLVYGMVGILPMANLLAIAGYRSFSRRTLRRPFFLGFATSAMLANLIWLNGWLAADERSLMAWNRWMTETLRGHPFFSSTSLLIGSGPASQAVAFAYLISFIILATLPQLLLAISGGRAATHLAAASRRGDSSPASLP